MRSNQTPKLSNSLSRLSNVSYTTLFHACLLYSHYAGDSGVYTYRANIGAAWDDHMKIDGSNSRSIRVAFLG